MSNLTDEELARQLQAEYDEEYSSLHEQETLDYEYASSLVGVHELSDSDTGESITISAAHKKELNLNQATYSDSDRTVDEDELLEFSASNNGADGKKDENTHKSANNSTNVHELSDEDLDENLSKHNTKNADSATEIKPSVADAKPRCIHGSECYRKSSAHRRQFSHPERADDEIPEKRNKLNYRSPFNLGEKGDSRNKFGFYMTTVSGIPSRFNANGAIGIQDILSPNMGDLIASAQFNYMTDITWLVSQYPEKYRSKPLLIVHGEQRESKKALEKEASVYPHITLSQAKLEIMFGTHHTKMMLLAYEDGMRVVIHTANLIHNDWHQKSQGVWMSQKFPLRRECNNSSELDSKTNFKKDLLQYLGTYKTKEINQWCETIEKHDFTEANVFLIASTPGRHVGDNKTNFGHLKLRKVLREKGPPFSTVNSDWPVIGQFSSIGSLGATRDNWLCKEYLASLSCTRNIVLDKKYPKLQLIFPSVENVRLSLEGYPAGASLPYSKETASKQPWLELFFHQWKSEYRGRTCASPHIKTYCRLSPDCKHVAWFLVTSANLSKAAWGALEKGNSQLMIRSYELGVLFLPEFLDMGSKMDVDKFPMPFDVPLIPYSLSDKPWLWNAPHTDLPDRYGNMWCPS